MYIDNQKKGFNIKNKLLPYPLGIPSFVATFADTTFPY